MIEEQKKTPTAGLCLAVAHGCTFFSFGKVDIFMRRTNATTQTGFSLFTAPRHPRCVQNLARFCRRQTVALDHDPTTTAGPQKIANRILFTGSLPVLRRKRFNKNVNISQTPTPSSYRRALGRTMQK